MATAEQISARLENLKKIRAAGVLRTTHDGVTVEYRTMADLERAIGATERELADAQGGQPIIRRYLFGYDRDL